MPTHTPNRPSLGISSPMYTGGPTHNVPPTEQEPTGQEQGSASSTAGRPAQGSGSALGRATKKSSATAKCEVDVDATRIENSIRAGLRKDADLDVSDISGKNITQAEIEIEIDTSAIEDRLRNELARASTATELLSHEANETAKAAETRARRAEVTSHRAEKVAARMNAVLDQLEPKPITIQNTEGEQVGELEGLQHKQTRDLLKACTARDKDGNRLNILITGGAGGGKSTATMQVAKALGLDYSYTPRVNMDYEVLGKINQISEKYYETKFVERWRHGGKHVFEEWDAYGPGALLCTNTALANGVLTLPTGEVVERHPDCVIVACANTWGTGATAEYVGRNRIDAAQVDRFIKIHWEYDLDLERRASDNEEAYNLVTMARANAEEAGLHVMITPRSTFYIASLMNAGFNLVQAAEMAFLAPLDKEQRRTVLAGTFLE